MTWIKPSFAWVLYRSGYGKKDINQKRILKLKLRHDDFSSLVSRCTFGRNNSVVGEGRIQWDPERDLYAAEWHEKHGCWYPKRCTETRAIQIGLKGSMSEEYVGCVVKIEDVTELANLVGEVHTSGTESDGQDGSVQQQLQELQKRLPNEKQYRVCTPAATDESEESL